MRRKKYSVFYLKCSYQHIKWYMTNNYFASGRSAKYCDERVCMSVCLSVYSLAYVNKCSALPEVGDRLATIDMGLKIGAVSLLGGGAGSPCNTVLPGPRPTVVSSGILILSLIHI